MATAHIGPRPRTPHPHVLARGATKAERKPRNPIAACARSVGILASTAFSVVVLGHDGLPDDLRKHD